MAPIPLLILRGGVFRIKFEADDPTRPDLIPKYCLSLQQGSIIHNRPAFVGVLLTTCKDNNRPRMFPWSVYVSPGESHTEYGVLIDCSVIYTVPKTDIISHEYSLREETMAKVNQALQFGTGILTVESLKRPRPTE